MSTGEPSPEAKQAFFKELHRLEDPSGSESDNEDLIYEGDRHRWKAVLHHTSIGNHRGAVNTPANPNASQPILINEAQNTSTAQVPSLPQKEPNATHLPRPPLAELKPRRTASGPASFSPASSSPSRGGEQIRAPLQPLPLERSATMPNPLVGLQRVPRRIDQSRIETSSSKKRKKDSTYKGPLFLEGLRFFFIPNDDHCAARKARMEKAESRGGIRTQSLDDATHVIVNHDLTWDNIKSILARSNGLEKLTIVNDSFIPDCVSFRTVVDAHQTKYQVPGRTKASSVEKASKPVGVILSKDSLPLKPAQRNTAKWDYAPPPGTPSRSQEPSDQSNDNKRVTTTRTRAGQATHSREATSETADQGQKHAAEPTTITQEPYSDALSDIISEMVQIKDLPLDKDDDDSTDEFPKDSASNSDLDSGSEGERERKRQKTGKARRKIIALEDRFACNRGGTLGTTEGNPNARVIEVLQKMCDHYDHINDNPFRVNSYRKAITKLKGLPTKITTAAEAKTIAAIGDRIALKIEEIVLTDRLRQLEYAENDPMNATLQTFTKIYGVGAAQASRWYAKGYRTLEDLKLNAELSTNQKVGIDHYDDLNTRIPRREVRAVGDYVKAAAAEMNQGLELIIGGSYRRGAPDSGDIDFIVTKVGTTSADQLLASLLDLVQILEAEGFLVARLASSKDQTGSKWHGCCVLPKTKGVNDQNYRPIWRRIDFLIVPESEMGAALIYFTGNEIFNRSIRLLASRKHMRLNQRGLYMDCLRGPGRAKVSEGELVESRDEKKIFEILGVRWREPHERWC